MIFVWIVGILFCCFLVICLFWCIWLLYVLKRFLLLVVCCVFCCFVFWCRSSDGGFVLLGVERIVWLRWWWLMVFFIVLILIVVWVLLCIVVVLVFGFGMSVLCIGCFIWMFFSVWWWIILFIVWDVGVFFVF